MHTGVFQAVTGQSFMGAVIHVGQTRRTLNAARPRSVPHFSTFCHQVTESDGARRGQEVMSRRRPAWVSAGFLVKNAGFSCQLHTFIYTLSGLHHSIETIRIPGKQDEKKPNHIRGGSSRHQTGFIINERKPEFLYCQFVKLRCSDQKWRTLPQPMRLPVPVY